MKKVYKNSKHIRWNWRESPESIEGFRKSRYYFCVADNKFREEKIKRILDTILSLTIINFHFQEFPSLEGKVEGTPNRYLCKIYDSSCHPDLVQTAVHKVFKNVVKDSNLYERSKKNTSLEKYLENFYSK